MEVFHGRLRTSANSCTSFHEPLSSQSPVATHATSHMQSILSSWSRSEDSTIDWAWEADYLVGNPLDDASLLHGFLASHTTHLPAGPSRALGRSMGMIWDLGDQGSGPNPSE